MFAPIRLGAIEEVTVSTAGLTADAGAEGRRAGAVRRPSAAPTRSAARSSTDPERKAQRAGRSSTRRAALPKTQAAAARVRRQLRRPDPPEQAVLLRQLRADLPAERDDAEPHRADAGSAAGHLPLPRHRQHRSARSTCSTSRARTACRAPIDPFIASSCRPSNGTLAQGGPRAARTCSTNTFRVHQSDRRRTSTSIPTARVDYQATPSLAVRGVLNLHYRDLPRNPQFPGLRPSTAGSRRPTTSSRPAPTGRSAEPVQPDQLRRAEQLRGVQSGQHARRSTTGAAAAIAGRRCR